MFALAQPTWRWPMSSVRIGLTSIRAATDGEHYVAEFEYGGIGYHRTILMVSFDNSSTAKVLGVTDGGTASSVDELIKAASTSKTPFWRELARYH